MAGDVQDEKIQQSMKDQGIDPQQIDEETKRDLDRHMHGAGGDDEGRDPDMASGDSIPRPSEDGDADDDLDEGDAGQAHDRDPA